MERYCEQEKSCLRVYVPRELDHHEADRLKQEADFFIAVSYTHLTLPTTSRV